MKIVLTTPLYPPDIAEPAPYTKELARRLKDFHDITIVTYGDYPEKVDGVNIVAVSKRQPLPLRLVAYIGKVFSALHEADIVYSQNGPSVELPVSLLAALMRKPFILRIGDPRARKRAERNPIFRIIQQFACAQAQEVLYDTPLPKPEILPYENRPIDAFRSYEESWEKHIMILERTCKKYAK